MKTIYKFEFELADAATVTMPVGAKILTVQVQRGVPCLWAAVDLVGDMEQRIICTYGTGQSIESLEERKYIGTYQLHEGSLVFHVFEKLKKET